jgi:hypothetical protein
VSDGTNYLGYAHGRMCKRAFRWHHACQTRKVQKPLEVKISESALLYMEKV